MTFEKKKKEKKKMEQPQKRPDGNSTRIEMPQIVSLDHLKIAYSGDNENRIYSNGNPSNLHMTITNMRDNNNSHETSNNNLNSNNNSTNSDENNNNNINRSNIDALQQDDRNTVVMMDGSKRMSSEEHQDSSSDTMSLDLVRDTNLESDNKGTSFLKMVRFLFFLS